MRPNRADGSEFCIQPKLLEDTTFPYEIVTKICGDDAYKENELFYFGKHGEIIAKKTHVDGRKSCLTRGGTANALLIGNRCLRPDSDNNIPTRFLFFRGFNSVITNINARGDVKAITFGGDKKPNVGITFKPIDRNFPLSQKFYFYFEI